MDPAMCVVPWASGSTAGRNSHSSHRYSWIALWPHRGCSGGGPLERSDWSGNADTHTNKHSYISAYIYADTHRYIHTNAYINADTHRYIHANANTHTHTDTNAGDMYPAILIGVRTQRWRCGAFRMCSRCQCPD